jgi:hypothetical protein
MEADYYPKYLRMPRIPPGRTYFQDHPSGGDLKETRVISCLLDVLQLIKYWCRREELNPRPSHYE